MSKIVDGMANSVDSDQTCPKTRIFTVVGTTLFSSTYSEFIQVRANRVDPDQTAPKH